MLRIPNSVLPDAPLIQVAQNNQPNPPASNLLVRLATSIPGRLLATSTVKAVSGMMIGAGLVLVSTGAGVGLIGAGVPLWMLATASTIAGRDDSIPSIDFMAVTETLSARPSIAFLVGNSVAIGATGGAVGALCAVGGIQLPVKLTVAPSLIFATFIVDFIDHCRNIDRPRGPLAYAPVQLQ